MLYYTRTDNTINIILSFGHIARNIIIVVYSYLTKRGIRWIESSMSFFNCMFHLILLADCEEIIFIKDLNNDVSAI